MDLNLAGLGFCVCVSWGMDAFWKERSPGQPERAAFLSVLCKHVTDTSTDLRVFFFNPSHPSAFYTSSGFRFFLEAFPREGILVLVIVLEHVFLPQSRLFHWWRLWEYLKRPAGGAKFVHHMNLTRTSHKGYTISWVSLGTDICYNTYRLWLLTQEGISLQGLWEPIKACLPVTRHGNQRASTQYYPLFLTWNWR